MDTLNTTDARQNPILDKSFDFALKIVKLCRSLQLQNEYVLSRQLLRSGTSVGALVREAQHAESKADFIHKLSIGLKEGNESCYWIELLYHAEYIDNNVFSSIHADAKELVKLLVSIIKSSKNKEK